MWWTTQKTHHQNVSTQLKDTKINQFKIELQERINNWKRDREQSPFWERNWENNKFI